MKSKRVTKSTPDADLPSAAWLIFAFGLRHILADLLPLASRNFYNYSELFASYWYLISDVLVLLVLVAYTHRLPESSKVIRTIWRQGQLILGAAFVLDITLSAFNHLKILTNSSSHQFGVLVTTLIIDLVILLYLSISKEMKEAFSSFPEPDHQIRPDKSTPIKSRLLRSNIPNEPLLRREIVPGYRYADFPFPSADTAEPILRIRNHIENNRLATAEKGLRFLLEKEPINSLYWHELGMLAIASNKLEQAEALILKAMLLETNNFTYTRNLGEVRRRLGFFDEAIKYANLAIKINPDDTTAQYNLGVALWDAGKNDQALELFENLKQMLILQPDKGDGNPPAS